MKVVVGLGNPGKAYEKTRHNVGFDLLDALASAHGAKIDNRRDRAKTAKILLGETPVLLVKPLTFMNLSGEAVSAILEKESVAPESLLVVCDDIHLPVGRMRLRGNGSSGGQNGLKSIEARLGTQAWARLRLGVGSPPPGLQIEWVLSRFHSVDRKVIDDVLIAAQGAVEVWAHEGAEAAMNRFNPLDLRAS